MPRNFIIKRFLTLVLRQTRLLVRRRRRWRRLLHVKFTAPPQAQVERERDNDTYMCWEQNLPRTQSTHVRMCVCLYRFPICVSVYVCVVIGGNRWFCLFAHVESTWQAVRLSTPSSCCCYYCCDKCFSPEHKKSCAAGLSGLSIHADTHSIPPVLSLSLSMVVIYLIACKKPTHTHITITRKKIQIPSTAQARNQQESYRCVSVHTHNIWVYKQLAASVCVCA